MASAKEQQERVWTTVCSHNNASQTSDANATRTWPSYDVVFSDVTQSDYNSTLTCPHDFRQDHPSHDGTKSSKALCAFGVAACCRMELFPAPDGVSPYTGLLSPGHTLENCIVRLSSAIKPPALESGKSKLAKLFLFAAGSKTRNAKLFPTAAIKVFRDNGTPSGNLLFGGCKVGQAEEDYFAHCMCTQMTERMPRTLKPLVRPFRKYSQYPLSLGVSGFCAVDTNGVKVESTNFPFCVVLSPCYKQHNTGNGAGNEAAVANHDAFDTFLDDALEIPIGTAPFNVFACPHPRDVSDPSKLQRIGRIVTTSNMVPSSPHDELFFRHQRKEEDYDQRPEWKRHLKSAVRLEDGTTGTVDHLAGWELFEQHISQGAFVDFEREMSATAK